MKTILALLLISLPAFAKAPGQKPASIFGTWVYTIGMWPDDSEVRMQIGAHQTTIFSRLMGCEVTITFPSAVAGNTYTILRSATGYGNLGQCRSHVDAERGTYVIRGNSLTLSAGGRVTTYQRAR